MHEQQKLQEADYFYSRMIGEIENPDPFRYNLSAFLTAARSVLQYALLEAESKLGGQSWYDTAVSNSDILQFFRGKRDINIHTQPVQPSLKANVAVQDTIRFSTSLSIIKRDAEGNIVEEYSSPPKPRLPERPHIPASTHYHYTFTDWAGDEDVPTLAEMYLQELKALVQDGAARGFLTP